MRINLRRFIFIACLFSLGMFVSRIFKPVAPLREPAGLEGLVSAVPAAVSESRMNDTFHWRSRESAGESEPMSSVPPELPEDPDQLREWARQHPQQALTWLPGANAGQIRDIVVEMVCARIAEFDPAEAVSVAEHYSGGCSNLLENLIHQWANQNGPEAKAYAMNKPPGPERDRLLSRVAVAGAKENPTEAARLVAEWISPGEIQAEAAISVLHQWALFDPDAALQWAQLFPEDDLRDRALNEVAAATHSIRLE